MKQLRIIKDEEYLDGFALIENANNYAIYINIEKLWKAALNTKHKEDNFIKYFSGTYTHELLHCIIKGIYNSKDDYGEEIVIRKMLAENMHKSLIKYYKNG